MNPTIFLRLFIFFFYGLQGVAIPYLPLWFAEQGLSNEAIGILVSVAFLPKLISNPLFSHFADTRGHALSIIRLLLISTIALYPLYLLTDSHQAFLLIAIAINFATPPIIPLIDRISIGIQKEGKTIYASTRVWGSLGFASSVLANGFIIQKFGVGVLIIEICFIACGCLIATLRMPDSEITTSPEKRHKAPLLAVTKNRYLLSTIVGAALIQASNGFLYSYSSIAWKSQGIDSSEVGLLWAIGISSEIAFFFLGVNLVDRLGAYRALVVAATLTAVRWAILGSTSLLMLLMLGQILQCFTIALNSMAIMSFIGRHAHQNEKATSIALYTSLAMGAFIFLSIYIGKFFFISLGISGFYAMALISLSSIPFIILAQRKTG